MDWLLEKMIRYPRRSAAAAIVVFIIAVTFIWWSFIWQRPQRAFEDMLANNLAAASVTKMITVSGNGQNVEQLARLQMGSTNAADWLVVAKQSGTSVTTESIGTPTTGYIRYPQIEVKPLTGRPAPYNFKKVLNVWAKSDGKTDVSLNSLFAQTLLDVGSAPLPPIADLPNPERHSLLAFMQDEKVFAPTYQKVKRETINGRAAYTYQVAVKLGAYVRLMQAFAHDLGLKNLDSVDPSQYAAAPPVQLTMSVDKSSHQLVKAAYAATHFTQSYTDWGVVTPITLPHTSITTTELQRRIQSVR